MRQTEFFRMTASLCLLMALTAPGHAQDMGAPIIVGGSNIGLTQYPQPNCTKPVQPEIPVANGNDRNNPDNYNSKVRKYNNDLKGFNTAVNAFNDCMHTYVENGNADMLRIKQTLEAAIAASR